MVFLVFAILISSGIVIAFRVFEQLRVDVHLAITMNYLVASAFGILSLDSPSTRIAEAVQAPWIPIALVTGVLFIVVFYFFAFSAVKAGVAITAVSSKMSVVIPVIAGFTLFGEAIIPLKLMGVALALTSFVLIFWKPGARTDLRFIFLPLLLFLGNGINDTLLKTSEHRYLGSDQDFILFLSVVFIVALVLGLIHITLRLSTGRSRIGMRSLGAGVVLGLLNWGSTWFFLKGLSVFDVSLFVPVFNAGVVVLSAIAGILFFRERLTRINLAGLFLAIVAISLIAAG